MEGLGSPADAARQLLEALPPVMRRLRRDVGEADLGGLTLPQFRVLAKAAPGGRTAGELAAEMGVSLPALSRMAASLARRGHLSRTRAPRDRRLVHVTLTPRGRRAYRAVRARIQADWAARIARLDARARRDLLAGLASLRRLAS